MSSAKWVTKNYATEERAREHTHNQWHVDPVHGFELISIKKSWYPVKKGFVCMKNSWRCSAGGAQSNKLNISSLYHFFSVWKSKTSQKGLKLINYILISVCFVAFFCWKFENFMNDLKIVHHNRQNVIWHFHEIRKIHKNMERKQQRRKLRKSDAIAIGEFWKVHALHCIFFDSFFYVRIRYE